MALDRRLPNNLKTSSTLKKLAFLKTYITKNAKGEKGLKIRAELARPPFRAMLERKHFFQKPFPYIIYIKNEIATLSDTKFSIPPPSPIQCRKK